MALYKFKSKAGADVIMVGPHGDHVLKLMGKTPQATGIIEPDSMPGAISALESAVVAEEAERARAEAQAQAEGVTLPPREGVSLRQRVWPLIDLMKRAHAEQLDIVWGV